MLQRSMFPAALATCVAALLASGTANAQIVFTGVIEPATTPSTCQEESHFVECSGKLLKSTTLDLDAYVGKTFRYTAVPRGVTCEILDVVSVEPASATLVTCGNPVPGCSVRFRVGPTGVIGQWSLFMSLSSDFVPLNPIAGTVMLGFPYVNIGSGLTFGETAALDIGVPPVLALTGLKLYFQGIRNDIGPIGPKELTNPVCFTVFGPSPPCTLLDC